MPYPEDYEPNQDQEKGGTQIDGCDKTSTNDDYQLSKQHCTYTLCINTFML